MHTVFSKRLVWENNQVEKYRVWKFIVIPFNHPNAPYTNVV